MNQCKLAFVRLEAVSRRGPVVGKGYVHAERKRLNYVVNSLMIRADQDVHKTFTSRHKLEGREEAS